MDYEVNALPLHVLLVHATVVFIPLTALCIVLSIFWPAVRRRLGIITPLIALLALVLVPISQQAGHWFVPADGPDAAGRGTHAPGRHDAALGDRAVHRGAGGMALVPLRNDGGRLLAAQARPGYRIIAAVMVVVVLAVCAGATMAVVQTGESGSRAAWEGPFPSRRRCLSPAPDALARLGVL